MIDTNFKSIIDLLKAFPDEQICIDHLEKLRWNGNVVSPFYKKRYICGIYHSTTRKHLQRYVDEFVFRYDTREEYNSK